MEMESREFLPKCLFSARRLQLILVEFYTRTLQLAGPTQCCRIAESKCKCRGNIHAFHFHLQNLYIHTSQDPPGSEAASGDRKEEEWR
jgi:hypothetical protein